MSLIYKKGKMKENWVLFQEACKLSEIGF